MLPVRTELIIILPPPQIDAMLSGQLSLEDFVQNVERSSGIERWALWMEISGRLQIAQHASGQQPSGNGTQGNLKKSQEYILPSVKRSTERGPETAKKSNQDELNSLQKDRLLAQSIMKRQLLSTRSTQTTQSDFSSIPFLDDGPSELVLDDSRPDEKSRVVYASPSSSKRHDGVSSSQSSASRTTGGRRLPSGQSSASARRPFSSAMHDAIFGPGSDALAPPPVAALRDAPQSAASGGESRAAAMQLLLQCLRLSRPQLSDVVTHRLKSIVNVDVCRLLFVESGRDGPELVQVRPSLVPARGKSAQPGPRSVRVSESFRVFGRARLGLDTLCPAGLCIRAT